MTVLLEPTKPGRVPDVNGSPLDFLAAVVVQPGEMLTNGYGYFSFFSWADSRRRATLLP